MAETSMTPPATPPSLRRTVGPAQLTFYALGSMLGSGIYGLIGQAAGQVGNAVWLSFVVAFVAALLTGLSYASLGSRHPHAGGAAFVVQRAFRSPMLGFLVGLAVACASLASVATQSRVFAASLAGLLGLRDLPPALVVLGFLLVLTALVLRGIREAMWVNVLCTVVEAGGLLVVTAAGLSFWGSVNCLETPAGSLEGVGDLAALLVLQGAVLTFFAFIGFEDSINVAEECRDPRRTIPLGLVTAMAITAVLYVAVAVTAVSVVPWKELEGAPSPLTAVMERAAPSLPPAVFSVITLFAVSNTALVNYVTASRLVYGMARQGLLPARLGAVHEAWRTPHLATLVLLAFVAPLALAGTVADLAAATVILLLAVFTVVNLALVVLKRREAATEGRFEVPVAVPLAGAAVCAALVAVRVATGSLTAPMLALGLVAGILLLHAVTRRPAADPGGDAVP